MTTDEWWECSQCGALSMHWTDEQAEQCECVNCDEQWWWYPPWWTIFWCSLIGAAIWAGLIWWIFT